MSPSPATIRIGVRDPVERRGVVDRPVGREHVAGPEVRVELLQGPGAGVFQGVAVEPVDRPLVDVRMPCNRTGRSSPGPGRRPYIIGRPSLPVLRPSERTRRALSAVRISRMSGVSTTIATPPMSTKLAIRSACGRELQEREHQHPAQAVADPVDPVAAGLLADVFEDRRDVVLRLVVDVPVAAADLADRGLAEHLVDLAGQPDPVARPRAPHVDDEDLVPPGGELARAGGRR